MQGAAPAPHAAPTAPLEDDVVRVLRDDGSLDPEHDPKLDPDAVVAIYGAMVRVRLLDERLVGLQRQGRIGFHIGSQGEEAAILGSAAALREHDWIFPCYREFGAALWRGMPLAAYVNHMFGNEQDPMKGRQMPDHYGAKGARFTSISSPVGTQITHAAGVRCRSLLTHGATSLPADSSVCTCQFRLSFVVLTMPFWVYGS